VGKEKLDPAPTMAAGLVLFVLLLELLHDAAALGPHSDSRLHVRYPRQYAAFYLQRDEGAIAIDGLLNDSAWENVAFTDPFVDIQGPLHWSQPWLTTKVKLRYDRTTLYVAAYMEETAVWANVTRRNDVIFHDNDFEVFIDADASTHNYKEIEVNARNASWNLWLNKPYRSGGHENSTRVDPQHGFDMVGKGLRCAVHADGPINDPAQQLHSWTVEMALPLVELARYTRATTLPPPAKARWRINFSRVEWQVRVTASEDGKHQHYEKIPGVAESNWVWSPQYEVDMHRPEWWGFLEFRDPLEKPPADPSTIVIAREPTWPLRYAAFQFFYAQEAYRQLHGRYADELDPEVTRLFPDQDAVGMITLNAITVKATGDFYWANLTLRNQPSTTASLQSDSLVTIHRVLHETGDTVSVE
jgi:hypothetical protein